MLIYQLPCLVIRASRSRWSCFSSLILEAYPTRCCRNSESILVDNMWHDDLSCLHEQISVIIVYASGVLMWMSCEIELQWVQNYKLKETQIQIQIQIQIGFVSCQHYGISREGGFVRCNLQISNFFLLFYLLIFFGTLEFFISYTSHCCDNCNVFVTITV